VPARRSVFFHQDASSSALRRAGVAIALFSAYYEIASVASLLRNDIVTQSLGRKGPIKYSGFDEKKGWEGGTQPKEDKMKKLVLLN